MRIRAVIAALPLLVLAACSSSSTAGPTTSAPVVGSSGAAVSSGAPASGADSSAAASGSASSSAAPDLGPTVPAATVVAPAVAASELPTASGKFGDKPTLTFPKTPAVPSLQRQILSEGTGETTKKGDYLVTHYLGEVWGGTKAFDNSYDRKPNTSTFQIGEGKVVPGWDVALVGVKVGSRVLLSLPPADGYGSAGGANGAIKGTDTIVFVVDIVKVIPSDATGQTDAVLQPPVKGLPTVTGALGKEPTITIPAGLAQPTANKVAILAKGTGAKLVAGSVLAQLVVTDWTKSQTQSTWPKAGATAATTDASTTGLQQITIDTTGALKDLVGVPIGSRVLVEIAPSTDASTGQASAAAVAVLDIVAQA